MKPVRIAAALLAALLLSHAGSTDARADGPERREDGGGSVFDQPLRPDTEHTVPTLEPVVTTPAPTEISPGCDQLENNELRIEACTLIISHPGTSDGLLTDAYAKRAMAHHRRGEFGQAIADFSAALELSPDDPVILDNRGNSYALRNNEDDLRRALEDHTRAVELAPQMASAWNNRAADYLDLNDTVSAVSDLDKALAIDPDYRDARINRMFVRCRLGLMGGTLDDLELALGLPNVELEDVFRMLERAGRFNGVGEIAGFETSPASVRLRVKAYCRGGDAGIQPRVDGRLVLQPRRGPEPSDGQ